MHIALMHFRVGFTDGVSLEMEKWKWALESLGHSVSYIAGEAQDVDAFIIPELSIKSPIHHRFFKNAFEARTDYADEAAFMAAIYDQAQTIETALLELIHSHGIECLIPNNIQSLGLHLPAGIALSHVVEKTGIQTIFHHHDFHWERDRYQSPTSQGILNLLKSHFPDGRLIARHCVINQIAQGELKKRTGLESYVVPNVFDFHDSVWKIDSYNQTLIEKLAIRPHDLVFLQATRIEDRKAIELAIDTLVEIHHRLPQWASKVTYKGTRLSAQSTLHFILAGLNEMNPSQWVKLKSKLDAAPFKVHIISDLVTTQRQSNPTTYALWDVYPIADWVTYPSILEGFGNQLLEAMFAKKPLLIYEYPVYVSDIKAVDLDVVSLGHVHHVNDAGMIEVDPETITHAATEILTTLTDKKRYTDMIERNFAKGVTHYSYATLKEHVSYIIHTNK